ncbi:hypothetical protein BDV06DRAFT_136559 [Aspergillus oleicola]
MVAFHRIKSPFSSLSFSPSRQFLSTSPFLHGPPRSLLTFVYSCLVLPFCLPHGGECRWLVLWLFNLLFLPPVTLPLLQQ